MRNVFYICVLLLTSALCSGNLVKVQEAIKSQDQNQVRQILKVFGHLDEHEKRIAKETAKSLITELKEEFHQQYVRESIKLLGWVAVFVGSGIGLKVARGMRNSRNLATVGSVATLILSVIEVVKKANYISKLDTKAIDTIQNAVRILKMLKNEQIA